MHISSLIFSDESPLLLGNPGDTTVKGGTRLSLVCVAWGNPLPNITWMTNPLGVPYQNIYTTTLSLNSLTYQVSILEICYALPELSGNYSCSSTNGVVSSPLGGNTASFQLQGEGILWPCHAVPNQIICVSIKV